MNQNIPLDVIYSANLMPKKQTKRSELPQNDPQYSHPAASRFRYFAQQAATLFLFHLKTRLQKTRPYQRPTIPTLKPKQLRRRHFVSAMARTAQNRITLLKHTGALPNPSHGPSSTGEQQLTVKIHDGSKAARARYNYAGFRKIEIAVHEGVKELAGMRQNTRQGRSELSHDQMEFSHLGHRLDPAGDRAAAPQNVRVLFFFNALKYFESPAVFAHGGDLSRSMMYVAVNGPDQRRTGTPYAEPANGHGLHTAQKGMITGDQRHKQRSQDNPRPTVGSAVTCRSLLRSLSVQASPEGILSCSRWSPGHPHLTRLAYAGMLTYPMASGIIGTIYGRTPRALVTPSTPTRAHHQVQRGRGQTAKPTRRLGKLGWRQSGPWPVRRHNRTMTRLSG